MYIFSALYNESDAFLPLYIENFLHFTDRNAVLIVNLGPGRANPVHGTDLQGRVAIINGSTKRSAFGHTLLMGHLESFDVARRGWPRARTFCTLASNALFVRPFDPGAAILSAQAGYRVVGDANLRQCPEVEIDHLPPLWWWGFMRNTPGMVDLLKEEFGLTRMLANQIEGLFASMEEWANLHARMPAVHRLGELMNRGTPFPLEECLPVSVFQRFGSDRQTNICHNFWDRRGGNGRAAIADLLDLAGSFPPHICCMKWFKREPHAIETAAILRPWSRDLLAQAQRPGIGADPLRLVTDRMVLEGLAAGLRAREAALPAPAWTPLLPGDTPPVSYQTVPQESDQLVALTQADTGRVIPPMYGRLTTHGEALRYGIDIAHEAATLVRTRCEPLAARSPDAEPSRNGALYLSPARGAGRSMIRLRLRGSLDGPLEALFFRIEAIRTIGIGEGSEDRLDATALFRDHAVEGHEFVEFYYSCEVARPTREIWIGIPFVAPLTLEVLIDVVHSPLP